VPLVLNCDCDCDYPTKTLAEIRQSVYDGLGFIDPVSPDALRTLGDLRTGIMAELGFIGTLGGELDTLANLRAAVKNRLGLAVATLTNSYTVSALLAGLMQAIGAGAQASTFAPGQRDTLLGHINEAQQVLWRRLELDKGSTALPSQLSLDSETTTLDGALVLTYAKGLAKASLGQPDAKAYFDEVERLLAAQSARKPPNIDDIIDEALREAQRSIYRRFENGATGNVSIGDFTEDADECSVDAHLLQLLALVKLKTKAKQEDAKELFDEFEHLMADRLKRSPPGLADQINRAIQSAHQTVCRRFEIGKTGKITIGPLAEDSDEPSCDDQPVYLLALANLQVKYKVGDAKLTMSEYEQYMQDSLKRSPPDRKTVVDRIIKQSQEKLFQRYTVFRGERWYTWTLEAGERFYGIGENDEATGFDSCTKTLDPRHVTWVGVSDGDVNWRRLKCGVPPEVYSSPVTGVPTHYEIRQCIEIWPNPIDGWKLRVKGHFGLAAFAADNDVTSMDWQAVELLALADAKAHYKQADAQIVRAEFDTYLRNVIGGQHHTRRYIPGRAEPLNAVMPKMAE
jgi:hypothetical protein